MASSFRVSSSFLSNLKAIFPECTGPVGSTFQPSILRNPWYIVAAVAFSASNRPEGVPQVFEYALADLRAANSNSSGNVVGPQDTEKFLAQRFREALFKSGLISGYPKVINSLKSLHEAMPSELRETKIQRDTARSLTDCEATGQSLFGSVYGEKAGAVQDLLDGIYPDMGWFSKVIGYGVVYGHVDIISPLETSYALVAALIAGDTPQQIAWHLEGAQRGGASFEEVTAVREASIRVAELSGIQWHQPIPELKSTNSE